MAEFVTFENHTGEKSDPSKSAVVTSFSNGRLKIESESSNSVQFGYFASSTKSIAKRDHKILVAESDRMRYIGKNFGADATAAPSVCKYMLGVYDRRTSKVRLFDASLFHLRPSLEDSDDSDADTEKRAEEAEKQMTYAEKQARLILQFGTAKGKRAVNARMRNQVDAKQLETALKDLAKESQETLDATEETPESAPSVIPPYNKDAERPEDVYLLDNLISPDEMAALVGPASTFIGATTHVINEWRESGKYPGYVVNQLSVMPIQSDIRRVRACQLMYWCYLHRLLHAGNKPNLAAMLSDVPSVIRQTLLSRFTIACNDINARSMYMIPRRLKDLLRSYMLVLCLLLEEFSLDFTALQRDLDLPLPQLEKCFQALGCKTSRQMLKDAVSNGSTRSFSATLVVPLKFPVYKSRAGRR